MNMCIDKTRLYGAAEKGYEPPFHHRFPTERPLGTNEPVVMRVAIVILLFFYAAAAYAVPTFVGRGKLRSCVYGQRRLGPR